MKHKSITTLVFQAFGKCSLPCEFNRFNLTDNLLSFFFFLAALGLRCCAQAFSSCGEGGAALRCGAQASLVECGL